MKTLIGMTDFVLEKRKLGEGTVAIVLNSIFKYGDFIKQTLEKWMFVPCDEDGNILVEPNILDHRYSGIDVNDFEPDLIEYQQAKERCLFEGFEYSETHINGIDNNLNLFIFPYANNRFGLTKKEEGFRTWFQLFTVEDLVQCDLQLTPNTQRQF